MATVDGNILLHNLTAGNDLFIMNPELTLPLVSIDVTIVSAEGSLSLPQVSIEIETGVGVSVNGELTLHNLTIEADMGVGRSCSPNLKLQNVSIEVTANIQNLVEGEITLPALSISCEIGQACTVSAELTLPDVLLSANAITAIAETFETWVVNAVNFAHAQYDNYLFNSYIELNGVCYGLNSTGIHSLTGTTDNGTAIAASAKWGVVNLGSEQKKIVDGGYINCRMSDALVVGLAADEGTRYAYTATDHGKAGIHAERWKSGKGVKGFAFQPDIANVAGADFDVAQLDLVVNKLQRRSG